MADFSVPILPIGGLDQTIARGPDLSWIGNIPNAYWQGQDQAYQQRNRNLFQNGVPADLATALLKAGGAPAAPIAVDLQNQELIKQIASRPLPSMGSNNGISGYNLPITGGFPPSTSATPAQAGVVPSTPTVVGDKEGAERGLYAPPVTPGARPPIQPEPQAQANFQQQPSVQPAGSRVAQGFQTTQAAPLAPFQLQAQQQEVTAARAEDIANELRARATAFGAAGPKYKEAAEQAGKQADFYQTQANDIRKSLLQSSEQTQGVKEYAVARSQGYTGTFQQFQNDRKAGEAEAMDSTKLLGKLAEKGLDAKGKNAQLDAVQQLGENVSYGAIPKIQSFLGAYGIETKGLTDIQAYESAIANLAPQLRPVGSGRLLQTELTAFKNALGGLMRTPEGRRISIENLKLLNTYSGQVGEIAADMSLQPSQRLAKIYALNPPKLRIEVTKTGPGAPAGSPGTAQAAPQFQEGQTIINRSTGERMMFQKGQWVPFT